MSLVLNEYTGDGVTTTFNFSMEGGYLSREFVVFLTRPNDKLLDYSPYTGTVTWLSDFSVLVSDPIPVGTTFVITRRTDAAALVDFQNTSRITERNLDTAFGQSLHRTAELEDVTARRAEASARLAEEAAEAARDAAEAATASSSLVASANAAAAASAVSANEAAINAGYATDTADEALALIQQAVKGNVDSFNGRDGAVVPQHGDYTPDMVGFDTVGVLTTEPAFNQVPSWSNPMLNAQAQALANRSEILRENQKRTSLHFGTLAEASATALPDGQLVAVSGEQKHYRVESGELVFVGNFLRNDLLDSSGASRVGYKQPVVGATYRAAQDKLAEKLSVYDLAGADGTGATDSTAAIQAAIDSVYGRDEIDLVGGTFTVGDISNPMGVHLRGGVVRKADPHGGYVQINSYTDDGKTFIGKEYLGRVFLRMKVGGRFSGYIYGDSTVASAANGGSYAGAAFEPDQLLYQYLVRSKGVRNELAFYNRAISGTGVASMNAIPDIDQTGGTTDLFIIKYGINDVGYGAAGFANHLRAKLAEIRAYPFGGVQTLSIILVGPNATYDPERGRSSVWYEQIRSIYVQAARDFKCAFFDTYAYLRDVDWTANFMMDNPYGNGQTVHPTEIMQNMIWAGLVDQIFGISDLTMYTSDKWVPLSMQNGWEHYGSAFAGPEASMSRDNWVTVRGLIKNGTVGPNLPIAALTDYAMFPRVGEIFSIATSSGPCTIRINTNGTIEQMDSKASIDYTSLSGIRFKVRG